MRLIEGTESYANGSTIGLSRDLGYSAPAHEFGHILGLDDEYTEEYSGETGHLTTVQNQGSLMGSHTGDVLERHLLQVYGALLRQQRP